MQYNVVFPQEAILDIFCSIWKPPYRQWLFDLTGSVWGGFAGMVMWRKAGALLLYDNRAKTHQIKVFKLKRQEEIEWCGWKCVGCGFRWKMRKGVWNYQHRQLHKDSQDAARQDKHSSVTSEKASEKKLWWLCVHFNVVKPMKFLFTVKTKILLAFLFTAGGKLCAHKRVATAMLGMFRLVIAVCQSSIL